ncbi:MAG: glycosyltransferase [bacterium]|nr:glycosyltransferase [bacterium]
MISKTDTPKVLVIPMTAFAENAGTFSRTLLLVQKLKQSQIDVALCAAEDANFRPIEGVKNYHLSVPMPLGLPKAIATRTFSVAQRLGVVGRKAVHSFDEVLFFTGNSNESYLSKSIAEIRNAIEDYKPDVIYSEFNIAAIVAAKLENIKLFITGSLPAQTDNCCKPQFAKGLNRILSEHHLPKVQSCIDLFKWAELRFVPSCQELEPFEASNVIYCGAWKDISPFESSLKDKILVYMGSGSIPQKKIIREIVPAFEKSPYSIYIAGRGLENQSRGNIHIASHFDFSRLLPETALFIHHGGQNSMIDALIYGVPQLICPGKVFERQYNAKSIVRVGAGKELSETQFTAEDIRRAVDELLMNPDYAENAGRIGQELASLGGIDNIVEKVKNSEVK